MKNMKEKNNNEEGKNVAAYDREVARCNKVVALCHTIEIAVISIAYFVEFIKGARTISYVLLTIYIYFHPFLLFCLGYAQNLCCSNSVACRVSQHPS